MNRGTAVGPGSVVEVHFEGHLTEAALRDALRRAAREEHVEAHGVLIDCLGMTSYELQARDALVEWRHERRSTHSVAVITDKALWHVVVSAMALASGGNMKVFATRDEAIQWLHARAAKARP